MRLVLLLCFLTSMGAARAQLVLGASNQEVKDAVQDYAETVRSFRLAAAEGLADAQYNLGLIYANGKGVLQDYAEAVRWYRMAAAQGDARAQYNLGLMYASGRGVVQDYVRAQMWLNIAAESGASKKTVENLDIFAEKMTSQQIAEAQRLARECQARKFQRCD